MFWVVMVLLSIVPADGVARERFDMLEQNAFYDGDGRLVFDQLLFWDWSHDAGRFQLQAWRMLKWQSGTKENGPISTMLPRFDHAHNVWVVEWLDGDVHRRIESPVFRQSVTQFDPELEERVYLPKEKRRELLRVKK